MRGGRRPPAGSGCRRAGSPAGHPGARRPCSIPARRRAHDCSVGKRMSKRAPRSRPALGTTVVPLLVVDQVLTIARLAPLPRCAGAVSPWLKRSAGMANSASMPRPLAGDGQAQRIGAAQRDLDAPARLAELDRVADQVPDHLAAHAPDVRAQRAQRAPMAHVSSTPRAAACSRMSSSAPRTSSPGSHHSCRLQLVRDGARHVPG